MKKIKVVFCLVFLSLFGCKEQKNDKNDQKVQPSNIESKISVTQNDNLNDFIGKYEYRNIDVPE